MIEYLEGLPLPELTESATPLHRGMSPHNVFVGYDGVVKVLDFGIAKVVGSDEGATKTGVLKGKLRYRAPEQVSGGDLDRRSARCRCERERRHADGQAAALALRAPGARASRGWCRPPSRT